MSATFVHSSKHRQGMKSFKVKTIPNRNDKQNVTAKTRARKLYREYLTMFSCVIIDDETYVLNEFKQLPGMCLYCHAPERRKGAFQDEGKGQVSQKIFGLAGNIQLWSSKP